MVLLDNRIENWSKVLVGVPVSSIDSTMLVVEFHSTGNGLDQSESRGLGLDSLQLLPDILCNMRGDKRMLGLDVGEWSIGLGRHCSVELNSSTLLKNLVLLPELIDTINHFLDQLNLGVSQSVLVGDVVSVTSLTTRLSTSTTGLQMKLLASGLQFVHTVLSPSRQVNMDRGPHASSQVGGARVNVSIFSIQTEVFSRLLLDGVTDSLDTSGQSLKDSLDISSLLHGDNSELILFVDPDQEGLGSIVEDTSALWPVSLHTSNSQISVSRHEEEVIIDKLLSDSLIHSSQRIVLSSKVSSEGSSGTLHQFLHTKTLLLGNSRRQTKSVNGATNTNSGRVNRNIRSNISHNLGRIHVGCVFRVSRDSMVLLDNRIENWSKVLVGVPVSSIDFTVLVVEL